MILDDIVRDKKEEVKAAKAETPQALLEERLTEVADARDFRGELRREGISLISEVKRHSPSRGDILPDVNAVDLAGLYEQCGARAISVLTDVKYFKGSLADLSAVKQHVSIPCLRKEFIIDPYQIYEARAAGADAILLIVRILSDSQLKEFYLLTKQLGMAALVETHSAPEIERALNAGVNIIGINNRDLDTLQVDFRTTLELKKQVPGGHTLVSESGIHTRDQVRQLEDGGVDAILVGESLLTSNDIAAKIRELLRDDEG